MESKRFDEIVRQAASSTSRRGALRLGIGALGVSALATLGRGNVAEGRRQKKKGRKRRLICFQGETLVVRRRKRFFKQGATRGACPPETCPADTPITCGEGCCPTEYPKCCSSRLGENPNNSAVDNFAIREAIPSTCNPESFNCCPVEQGGGSCGGPAPQCCPPTLRQPFGTCAPDDWSCCPAAQGGGACPPDFPVCCPGSLDFRKRAGVADNVCCMEGDSCCDASGECPAGFFCSGGPGDCCIPEDGVARTASSRTSVSGRFHVPVQ